METAVESNNLLVYLDLLKFLVPFLVAWNVWIHKMLISNEKDIAVNTAKDHEMWKRMEAMDGKLDTIMTELSDLRVDLAREQGKNSKTTK